MSFHGVRYRVKHRGNEVLEKRQVENRLTIITHLKYLTSFRSVLKKYHVV